MAPFDGEIPWEALRPAMETMTSEQLEKLQGILTPPQVVALLEVWQLLCAEKPKEKK